jgi:beta-N-acetylhexosaminidase
MIAHNAYTALDSSNQVATVSKKIITGLLREEIGFKGVISTDAMGMKGLTKLYPPDEGAALAIEAGCDIVLAKVMEDDMPFKTFHKIMDFVKAGRITRERLEESARRVLGLKYDFGLFKNAKGDPAKSERILQNPKIAQLSSEAAQRAAIVCRDRTKLMPLKKNNKILVVINICPAYMQANDEFLHPALFYDAVKVYAPTADIAETSKEMNVNQSEYILKKAQDFDHVVFFNVSVRHTFKQNELIRQLIKNGHKGVVMVTNDIYNSLRIKEVDAVVCTFSGMPRSMETAAGILFGKIKPKGAWPLTRYKQDDWV